MRSRHLGILLAAVIATSILQLTLGSKLTVVSARPDLVLLLVVTTSVVGGVEEGVLVGILGGMSLDMMSVTPFGTATIAMGLIGLATGLGESNIYRANLLIPLVAVFLATVFYHSFLLLALQAAGWSVEWISTLARQTIPGAAFNALLAPLPLAIVRRLAAWDKLEEHLGW